MLRNVKFIVVHCTLTSSEFDAELLRDSMEKGHRPYHGMIDRFGYFMRLMGCNLIADNSCPENESCYHLAYVGGINRHARAADTRNPLQWHTLYEKIAELKNLFPDALVVGADFMHENAETEKNPGFDVIKWLDYYKYHREDWIDYEEQEDGTWKYEGEPQPLLKAS